MAESAQRGYVLTADTAYLAPYRRSKDEVQKYVRQLDGAVALNAALSSCAPGVMAMNIDNGFGAAAAAIKILAITRR